MPVYNSEKYVRFAINSIIKQKYKNWELIIVNDSSNKTTKNILDTYKFDKIRIIHLKKNLGPYKAIDLALKKANGKYIAFLDSDDASSKNRIGSQVSELEKNKKIGLVISKYKIIDQRNKIIKNSRSYSKKEFNRKFPCENLCCNSSAMFRKSILKKIKFYNKNFFYSNDYNFYLKIFSLTSIKLINKYYTFYRVHKENRTHLLKEKNIIFESLQHLKWSKKKGLINKDNIMLYYKNLLKNYFKLFLIQINVRDKN